MLAKRLSPGDTIGIFCASHIAEPQKIERITEVLTSLGYRVKLGANIYRDTWGFIASDEERAADLNALVADDEVKMILFSGGKTSVETLPLIDFENIKRHPKLFSSYSDGTAVLNTVHAKTGLVTYYGFGPGQFVDLRHYDYRQFMLNFTEGYENRRFLSDSHILTVNGGKCSGTLIGGYTPFFDHLLNNKHFSFDPNDRYVLILEDHEKFSSVGALCNYLAFIEQGPLTDHVAGVIFGHYSTALPDDMLRGFERFAARRGIPAIYTDDFGHGTKHAIFPLGARATLDADAKTIDFDY